MRGPQRPSPGACALAGADRTSSSHSVPAICPNAARDRSGRRAPTTVAGATDDPHEPRRPAGAPASLRKEAGVPKGRTGVPVGVPRRASEQYVGTKGRPRSGGVLLRSRPGYRSRRRQRRFHTPEECILPAVIAAVVDELSTTICRRDTRRVVGRTGTFPGKLRCLSQPSLDGLSGSAPRRPLRTGWVRRDSLRDSSRPIVRRHRRAGRRRRICTFS